MSKKLLFYICILCPIYVFSTEWANYPYIKKTQDSVYITSKPFCEYGTYGKTTVQKGFNGKIIYQLDQYIYPSTFFSKDGNYRIETRFNQFYFYYRDSLIKSYILKDIIKNPPDYVNFNGMIFHEWIIDSFLYKNVFYALLIDGQLLHIGINQKLQTPKTIKKISLDYYKKLKIKADTDMFVDNDDEEFNMPEKNQVKCINDTLIEDIIKRTVEPLTSEAFYISVSIAFKENKAKIIGFFTTNYHLGACLVYKNDFYFDNSYDFIVFNSLKEIIENKITYTCSFDNNIEEWAFNYIVPINKHGKN